MTSHGLNRPRLPAPLGTNGALTGQEAATNVASSGMRRIIAWLVGAAGGVAAYRALRRPRALPETSDDRAEELRARLAQAREAGTDREEFEAGETPVDEVVPVDEPVQADTVPGEEAVPADPAARRRAVHEQARGALDEMQRDREGSAE
jgi:hypothetical protein